MDVAIRLMWGLDGQWVSELTLGGKQVTGGQGRERSLSSDGDEGP